MRSENTEKSLPNKYINRTINRKHRKIRNNINSRKNHQTQRNDFYQKHQIIEGGKKQINEK